MLFVHAWFMTGRHAPSFQPASLIVLFLLLLPFLWFSWIFRFCVSCSCVLLFVDSSSGFLRSALRWFWVRLLFGEQFPEPLFVSPAALDEMGAGRVARILYQYMLD